MNKGTLMSINELLRNLSAMIEDKNQSIFNYDLKEQEDFLKSLKKPRNNFERSYYQYLAQKEFYSRFQFFLINVFSLPLCLYYLLRFFSVKRGKRSITENAVFFPDGKPQNILPNSLKKEFNNIIIIDNDNVMYIVEDIEYVLNLFLSYPFSWLFLLKNIIKIGKYRFVIEQYNPRSIIVCAEYSFTSSILTDYCNGINIEHINVMHGEKLWFIRDSFFKFDRCYVWHKFYKELFISLGAFEEQFIIDMPDSMKFASIAVNNKTYDYTYYLGNETIDVMLVILQSLKILQDKGHKVAVRPHPRYSDERIVRELFLGIDIEDISTVTIEESILRTKNVVSLYSTVVNQAYNNGVNIVIDDVSNNEYFKKLKDRKYVMLNVEHLLLSKIIV